MRALPAGLPILLATYAAIVLLAGTATGVTPKSSPAPRAGSSTHESTRLTRVAADQKSASALRHSSVTAGGRAPIASRSSRGGRQATSAASQRSTSVTCTDASSSNCFRSVTRSAMAR